MSETVINRFWTIRLSETAAYMWNKNGEKNIFFFPFHKVTLSYYDQCMSFWLIIYHYFNYLIIIMSHTHHCPKLSETVSICWLRTYRQTSNQRHTLRGNKLVDHSDVVGASLSALHQLHLHSPLNAWLQWIGQTTPRQGRNHLSFAIWCDLY